MTHDIDEAHIHWGRSSSDTGLVSLEISASQSQYGRDGVITLAAVGDKDGYEVVRLQLTAETARWLANLLTKYSHFCEG